MPRRTPAIFFAQGSPGFVFAHALWTTLIGVAMKLAAGFFEELVNTEIAQGIATLLLA